MSSMTQRRAEIIRARKLRQQQEARDNMDQTWKRYVSCWFCGKPLCVNNYADRKVRDPRIEGVVICPFCRRHARDHYQIKVYKALRDLALHDKPISRRKALKLLRLLPAPPREVRDAETPSS